MQNKLIESNITITDFFENIPAEVVVLDIKGRYLYVSKDAIQNSDTRNWIIGKTDLDYCQYKEKPIKIAETRYASFRKSIDLKSKVYFSEIVNIDGGFKYYNRIYKPVLNAAGEINYVIGYGFDNTENHQKEIELSALKEAIDNSSEGIALLDANGNYFFMNKAHSVIFEYDKPQELYGKPWSTIYEQAEVDRINRDIMPILGRDGRWSGETLGIGRFGKKVPQYIALTIIPDGNLLCITRDISETQKLLSEQKKLSKAIELSNTCILTLDNKSRLEWANDYFFNLLGYSEAELVNQELISISDKKSQSQRKLIHLLEYNGKDNNHTGKAIITTKEGLEIPMLLSLTAMFNDYGQLTNYIIVQIDLSSIEFTQKQILDSLKTATELSDFKSELITIISHEFRTPLTAIQIYSELASKLIAKENRQDKLTHYIENINKQKEVINQSLNSFLMIGKIESGNVSETKKSTDTFDSIKTLIESTYDFENSDRVITLLPFGSLRQSFIDFSLISIVLRNLLDNAIKYSEEGSEIVVNVHFLESTIEISVRDFGIGIPEKEQHKIFSSFYRCANTSKVSGYGLGLSIVNQITKIIGGTISFQSELGVGTTFTFNFPDQSESTTS